MTYSTLKTRVVSLAGEPIEATRAVIREFESDPTTSLEDRLRLLALREHLAGANVLSGVERLERGKAVIQ